MDKSASFELKYRYRESRLVLPKNDVFHLKRASLDKIMVSDFDLSVLHANRNNPILPLGGLFPVSLARVLAEP